MAGGAPGGPATSMLGPCAATGAGTVAIPYLANHIARYGCETRLDGVYLVLICSYSCSRSCHGWLHLLGNGPESLCSFAS